MPLERAEFDQILATGTGWSNITALSDSQAGELARFSGVTIDETFLQSFSSLDSDSARQETQTVRSALERLRGSRGVLPLLTLKTLTVRQAEELAQFQGHTILLWGLKQLDSRAAEALARFRGDWNYAFLDLRGLETLTLQSARALSHFRGDKLNLDGVQQIDGPTALALGQSLCAELSLNGLRRLTFEQARALGSFSGEQLALNGLQNMTTLQARALAGFSGDRLKLSGMNLTDDAVVTELALFDGQSLDVSGLRYLSDGQAKSLAKFKGASLNLSGLQILDETQADYLGDAVCSELVLDGLTQITASQLKSLAQFSGKSLSLGSWNQFDIRGIETFSGDNLYLTGLTEMTNQTVNSVLRSKARMVWLGAGVIVSDKNFARLSQSDSVGLVLSDVTSLKRVPLQLLMTWNGGLEFNNVTELDKRFLPALAAWRGSALHLDGLRELRAAEAEALSGFHCAMLSLKNLRGLTDHDIKSLFRFSGEPLDVDGWSRESRRQYFQQQFAERK